MDIEWNPPEPRTGLAGQWDRFMGPGATDAEQWLMLIPSLLMTIGVLIHAYVKQLGWSGWQYLAAVIMAFDITGGLLISLYVFSPTPGLEWFLPFFYAKLLVCHLVKEAPFSPPARDGGIV